MNESIEEFPQNQEAFSASWREIGCAAASYFAAFWYSKSVLLNTNLRHSWRFFAVVVLLIGITEILNLNKKREKESFLWLGCLVICAVGGFLAIGSVWDDSQRILFIHLFFIWWALSRSGKLLEGKSGHLLPVDAFNGFLRIPFSNFLLRIRTLACSFRKRDKGGAESGKRKRLTALAAVLCLLLFILAIALLMEADESFAALLDRFVDVFRFEWDEDNVLYLIFSLPVGAWLFGLMSGSARMDRSSFDRQRTRVDDFLGGIRRVPVLFWGIVVGLFSALYLTFFAVQGSYLFGAFSRSLPEGFIVSEYARQGFFELCKVVAVNFSLLWLVTRAADEKGRENRAFLIVCALLLAESMVFAVIAFSKLALYISCFGFTPLRLQSTWLVCVLFAGCVLWMVTLFTGKPVFRKWMIFGAVTLTGLTII